MADSFTGIDPRMLGLRLQGARKARGLTQQDVAEQLDVARTTVTAMEKGERVVQPQELYRLAALYGRPLNELLRQREPLVDFSVQFRASLDQRGIDAPAAKEAIQQLQHLSEDYLELEAIRNSPLPRHYPDTYAVEGVAPEQAGEDVATAERNRLGLGDGPITNLREILENDVGLRIFNLPLPSKISALLGYTDRVGGCIAVNSTHPAERRRWSLAHEYAHFLTHRYQADVMVLWTYRRIPAAERFADSFARFFLMPSAGLARRFNEMKRARSGTITPADLVKLAHYYQVSFEALVRQLEEQRLLSAGTIDELIDRGFKVREAQSILKLEPQADTNQLLPLRYQLLAAEAYGNEEITEGQFARFVRKDRLETRDLYASLRQYLTMSEEGDLGAVGLALGEPIVSPRR